METAANLENEMKTDRTPADVSRAQREHRANPLPTSPEKLLRYVVELATTHKPIPSRFDSICERALRHHQSSELQGDIISDLIEMYSVCYRLTE